MFFVKVIIILSLVFVVFDSKKKNDKDINVICVYINFI